MTYYGKRLIFITCPREAAASGSGVMSTKISSTDLPPYSTSIVCKIGKNKDHKNKAAQVVRVYCDFGKPQEGITAEFLLEILGILTVRSIFAPNTVRILCQSPSMTLTTGGY